MKTNDKTIEVLKAATATIRAEYLARYTELEMATLVQDRAGLAAVGMDANQYADYPSGNLPRAAYRQALAKYNRVRFSFESVKSSYSHREPNIVVEKADAEPRKRASAKASADIIVDKYLFKLAAKIGKEIVSAETNGNIWAYALLKVTCADGEVQVWKTNCILNRSVYGTIFNQWPTRREGGIKPSNPVPTPLTPRQQANAELRKKTGGARLDKWSKYL